MSYIPFPSCIGCQYKGLGWIWKLSRLCVPRRYPLRIPGADPPPAHSRRQPGHCLFDQRCLPLPPCSRCRSWGGRRGGARVPAWAASTADMSLPCRYSSTARAPVGNRGYAAQGPPPPCWITPSAMPSRAATLTRAKSPASRSRAFRYTLPGGWPPAPRAAGRGRLMRVTTSPGFQRRLPGHVNAGADKKVADGQGTTAVRLRQPQ